jgi:hypothetical protein
LKVNQLELRKLSNFQFIKLYFINKTIQNLLLVTIITLLIVCSLLGFFIWKNEKNFIPEKEKASSKNLKPLVGDKDNHVSVLFKYDLAIRYNRNLAPEYKTVNYAYPTSQNGFPGLFLEYLKDNEFRIGFNYYCYSDKIGDGLDGSFGDKPAIPWVDFLPDILRNDQNIQRPKSAAFFGKSSQSEIQEIVVREQPKGDQNQKQFLFLFRNQNYCQLTLTDIGSMSGEKLGMKKVEETLLKYITLQVDSISPTSPTSQINVYPDPGNQKLDNDKLKNILVNKNSKLTVDAKGLFNYTNSNFPDLKIVYPKTWTLTETDTRFVKNSKLQVKNISLTRDSANLVFVISPKYPKSCVFESKENYTDLGLFQNQFRKTSYKTKTVGAVAELGYYFNLADLCKPYILKNTLNIPVSVDQLYLEEYSKDTLIEYQIKIIVNQVKDGKVVPIFLESTNQVEQSLINNLVLEIDSIIGGSKF